MFEIELFICIKMDLALNNLGLICLKTQTNKPIRNNSQAHKFRACRETIQLEPNDWPKFQDHLKNLQLADIHQTEVQTKLITKRNPMK